MREPPYRGLVLVTLLAQSVPTAATAPAVTAEHAGWVVIALALITTIGNVVLAVVRRTSTARLSSIEKTALNAKAKVGENGERIIKLEGVVTEHTHRIDDLDERLCAPPPHNPEVQRIGDRLTLMEGDMRSEKIAREARREEQHRQELALTREFSTLAANVTALEKQMEKINDR